MSVPSFPALLLLMVLLGGCSDRQEKSRGEIFQHQLDFSVEDYFKAVRNGPQSLVSAFLDAGMAVDVTDPEGNTALLLAAESGQGYIVEELLRRGARADQIDLKGNTPLMMAARSGNVQALQALLEAGADTSPENEQGLSALAQASMAGHASAVKTLAPVSRASLDYSLQLAAVMGGTDVLDVLLQNGASVLARSSEKRTALMYAAKNGQDAAVQLLVQRGSNVLALDNELQTAAMQAEAAGHPATAALLNDPVEREDVPPAPLDPPLDRLANQEFAPAEEGRTVSRQFKFHSYRERQLPFILQEVSDDDSTATVQMLTAGQEIVPLTAGAKIPGTNFVMSKATHALKPSNGGKGRLVDVSTLLIQDRSTQEGVLAGIHQPVTTADTYGVVREMDSGGLYEVRPGDPFLFAGSPCRVVEVRPAQVVVEEMATGKIGLIHK